MKYLVIVIILSFWASLFAPVSSPLSKTNPDNIPNTISQIILDNQEQNPDEFGEDEDALLYEQEIIYRKLFQKTLPPLSNKKKIIWAFRMSESDLFL